MKIYIINPDTKKPVTIEDWRKDENPTRAQLLAIETEDGHLLIMSKSYLPGNHTFEEAQKACAAFHPLESITFRAPSRKECIDIYDARFQGLDEAIKLTGGDYGKTGRNHWTGDRDTDPNYANSAWCCYGYVCGLRYSNVCNFNLALPVAVIGKPELDEVAKKIAYNVCKDLKTGEEKDVIVYYAILAAIAGAKWMAGIKTAEQPEGGCSEKPNNLLREQPEVGLEKEIKNYLATKCAGDDEPSVSEIARHFYELGLNARKG